MRRSRRNLPPPRTPDEREAARRERERRRAARRGERPDPELERPRRPAAPWDAPFAAEEPLPAPATAAARGEVAAPARSGRARNAAIFSVLTGFRSEEHTS